ncbi:MAG: hypothetical protein DI604_36625 [Delftia acidovorans]|nr:MAG: hypothetical protein DI604_36625 [Delftia acidovorans]
MNKCTLKTINVTANDTDPDGNYPLTVISASGSAGISAYVASSTSVQLESSTSTGSKTATYVVQDSLGATATGTITVTVVNSGSCS